MNTEVWIAVSATSEYGESPVNAKFTVTEGLKNRILEMQKVCVDYRLCEVHEWNYGIEWAGDFRLDCDCLVVTPHDFWFSAYVKHADYAVETRAQPIDEFFTEVDQGKTHFDLEEEPAVLDYEKGRCDGCGIPIPMPSKSADWWERLCENCLPKEVA